MFCKFIECPHCEELTPNELSSCIICGCVIPVPCESGCPGYQETTVLSILTLAEIVQ